MNIRCHTNLDLHPCERWTSELPCRPMVGDIITSSTGLELEVVRISFKEGSSMVSLDGYGERKLKETICHVELHLPKYRFENISKFQEWYKNRDRRRW
jgi:hypothetical protein